MVPLVWMFYQQRTKAAAKAEAAHVAKIQKEQTAKVLAAMKQDYPRQPKELKKMIKIARGTTGQADLQNGFPQCTVANWPDGSWSIWNSEHITGGNHQVGGDPEDPDNQKNGWDMTEDGLITVPLGAAPRIYNAQYTGEECEASPGIGGNIKYVYEFEVVDSLPPGSDDPICPF